LAHEESTELDDDLNSGETRDWWTGRDVTVADIFTPHFHVRSVYGETSGAHVEDVINGGHDPQRDGWTLQTLEPGASLRLGEHLEGFANYSFRTDSEGDFDGDWEEAFLKFKTPGDMEWRGGQFLNRFGFQSASHNHAWDYVDQNLLNGRFLQEGEFMSQGGDLTWRLPASFDSAFTVGGGGLRVHDHGHSAHAHHHHEEENHHH